MKKIILIFIATIIVMLNTCSDNPVNNDDNIPPGRRDYVWEADTLLADDWFAITSIWGSSPNDIWAVAVGTSYKDCLWHYDGEKWTKSDQWLSSGFYAIFGFSANNILAGDMYNTIWKYDGIQWIKFKEFSLPGYDEIIINDIFGTSENNIYAVGSADNYDGSGYKGIILKYNGTDWKYLNIPDIRVGFHYIKKAYDGNYIISATNYDNGFLDKIFVFDGKNKLTEIYSDYHWPGLFNIGENVYVTINRKIYKYRNYKLEFWKDLSASGYVSTVLGRSEKDFFGTGYGGIMHYNGSDVKILYPTDLDAVGSLILDKDVFFWGWNSEKALNVMIRGTLQDK